MVRWLPSPLAYNQIDCAVRDMVRVTFEKATKVLSSNEELLWQSARLLLKKDTLNESELTAILSQIRKPMEQQMEGNE